MSQTWQRSATRRSYTYLGAFILKKPINSDCKARAVTATLTNSQPCAPNSLHSFINELISVSETSKYTHFCMHLCTLSRCRWQGKLGRAVIDSWYKRLPQLTLSVFDLTRGIWESDEYQSKFDNRRPTLLHAVSDQEQFAVFDLADAGAVPLVVAHAFFQVACFDHVD